MEVVSSIIYLVITRNFWQKKRSVWYSSEIRTLCLIKWLSEMLEKNKVLAQMKKQKVRFLKNLFGTFYQAWTTYFWRVLTFIEALRQTTLSIIVCVLFAFSHFFHPLHIYFYTILPLFSIWRTSVQCSQQGYVLKKGNEWHIYFWNPNSYILYFEEMQQKNLKNFLLHFLLNFLNHKMLEWQFQKKK